MLDERVIEWTRNWKDEGIAEGMQRGMQKGMQQGMQQGKAQLLQTMLEARFGPLPDWALIRVRDGSAEELERWCLRILNQPTLQEVLV